MTAKAIDIDQMVPVINVKGMRESDVQKIQELEKAIGADPAFLEAEDLETACRAAAKHIGQTYEAVLAKYEEVKERLIEKFKSLIMGERELTDAELDAVDGGGFWGKVGGWFKNNWKKVVGVAVAAVTTAVGIGIGGIGAFMTATGGAVGIPIAAVGCGIASGAGTAAVGIITGDIDPMEFVTELLKD